MNSRMIFFVFLALSSAPVAAQDFRLQLIDPVDLEEMRGGYLTQNGLVSHFSIARSVWINDQLKAEHLVSGKISGGGISASQAGEITGFMGQPSSGTWVIQNTLDNQSIRTQLEVSVISSSAGALQAINQAQAITDALTLSLPSL